MEAKIRNLFVVPNAGKRDFFYGVNFELSYETPPFAQTRYALEIRPIIGVRNKEWEFIVNPIVDLSFGTFGQQDFAPAVRLARNLGEDRFIGIEYYVDFGQIGNFLPLQEQSHQIFAVTDFKLDKLRHRARRRLRPHARIGPAGHQGDHRLCVPGAGQKGRRKRPRSEGLDVHQNRDGADQKQHPLRSIGAPVNSVIPRPEWAKRLDSEPHKILHMGSLSLRLDCVGAGDDARCWHKPDIMSTLDPCGTPSRIDVFWRSRVGFAR